MGLAGAALEPASHGYSSGCADVAHLDDAEEFQATVARSRFGVGPAALAHLPRRRGGGLARRRDVQPPLRLARQRGAAFGVSGGKETQFIGVLDIFGFEDMHSNGFEQVFINTTNEMLQKVFNDIIFKSEEGEYTASRSTGTRPSSRTTRPASSSCRSGPTASSGSSTASASRSGVGGAKFAAKVNKAHGGSPFFEVCGPASVWRRNDGTRTSEEDFLVHHFAGPIVYTVSNFVDKNRDALFGHVYDVLAGSSAPVVAACFPPRPAAEAAAKMTVANKYLGQLNALVNVLRESSSRFVRCIKTNEDKLPAKLDKPSVLRQLVCSGVMAALEALAAAMMKHPHVAEAVPASAYRLGVSKLFMQSEVLYKLQSIKRDALPLRLTGRRRGAEKALAECRVELLTVANSWDRGTLAMSASQGPHTLRRAGTMASMANLIAQPAEARRQAVDPEPCKAAVADAAAPSRRHWRRPSARPRVAALVTLDESEKCLAEIAYQAQARASRRAWPTPPPLEAAIATARGACAYPDVQVLQASTQRAVDAVNACGELLEREIARKKAEEKARFNKLLGRFQKMDEQNSGGALPNFARQGSKNAKPSSSAGGEPPETPYTPGPPPPDAGRPHAETWIAAKNLGKYEAQLLDLAGTSTTSSR
ncbi:hypothetical protein JL721_2129 [Aureococcus anophagefferens]|nr:hypothetical protein JL721_2129 [Aureococcus anophagefferens]